MAVETIQIRQTGTQGEHLIVVMPAEIDITNAAQVREVLLRVLNRADSTLIIDMSATTFCDVAGVRAIERAYQRARACRTQLRLVVQTPAVRRILTLTGIHRIIAVYPSLAAARPVHCAAERGTIAGRDGLGGDAFSAPKLTKG
ncbi:MAG: rsbV5 [Actinoallomurus sp.]|nr:rsbV5 [Actinoallomurus sp.]